MSNLDKFLMFLRIFGEDWTKEANEELNLVGSYLTIIVYYYHVKIYGIDYFIWKYNQDDYISLTYKNRNGRFIINENKLEYELSFCSLFYGKTINKNEGYWDSDLNDYHSNLWRRMLKW